MDLLSELTKNQREAVTHGNGPVLVVAGAGTGKTAVITRRIAWLITEKKVKPEEILALTFTDKAAIEMEERVDELVPYGFVDTWISTFHAFCDKVLRNHAIELDLPVDFRVLSEPEQVMFFQEHLFDFSLSKLRPVNNPSRYIRDLIKIFSKIKDEDINANDYIREIKNQKSKIKNNEREKESLRQAQGKSEDLEELEIQLEIGKSFGEYNELLHKNGYVDFGDQITLTLKLFRENPRILKEYQKQFKYVLVDEFQDTNFAQNELLKLLAPGNSNLMVVGDDDQSIYRFRGAAISNILDFISTWKKAKQIVLTENFRSAAAILDHAYLLITQNNPNRLEATNDIKKKLAPAGENRKREGRVTYQFSQTFSGEADWVAAQIIKETKKGKEYKDIAILLRKNSDSKIFEQAIAAKGIPFKFSGNGGLYSRPEIINLISFIGVLCNPENNLALFHLSTGDIYELSIPVAVKLNIASKKMRLPVEEIYQKLLEGELEMMVDEDEQRKIERIYKDIADYRERMKELTAGQLLYRYLTESGYLKRLLSEVNKNAKTETEVQNIAVFFDRIKDFETVSNDKSLLNFYENLELLMQAGENPASAEIDPDLDAINLITVHKAKGLEFDVVFMVNLVNGNFPQRRHSDTFEIPETLIRERLTEGDFHLEEERRLFYVAMTRAKEKLYLSASEDHGGSRRQKISQFVVEAMGNVMEVKNKYKLEAVEKLKSFEFREELQELINGFYEDGKTLVLTPHQIDDYLSCPLKFKYAHIFKLPLIRSHTVMYGSAIHVAVQFYFEAKKRGKKISIKDLWAVFERSWIPEGFFTKKHEEERFAEGKETLAKFFERAQKESSLPSKIEEPFSFVLIEDEKRIRINGRYDAVYELNDEVEIRDFKTSDVRTAKDAEKRAKDNRQISIYALSWRETTGKIPGKVTLDFIQSGEAGVVRKTEKELEKTEKEIEKVSDGIRNGDFEAKPGWGECGRCAYRSICPFEK